MDQRNFDDLQRYSIDIKHLGLWYLDNLDRKCLNCLTGFFLLFSVCCLTFLKLAVVPELGIFWLIWMNFTLISTILSVRSWWIWNWNRRDQFFLINIKIKLSTAFHLICLLMTWITTIVLKTSSASSNIFLDIIYTYPMVAISVILNLINIIRLVRLYTVWHKIYKLIGTNLLICVSEIAILFK